MKMKYLRIGYRFLIVLAVLIGILDLMEWRFQNPWIFAYYTLQANMFVLLMFTVLAIRELKPPKKPRTPTHWGLVIRAAITMSMLVTGLVYNFELAPRMSSMTDGSAAFSLGSFLLHTVVPILTLADWFLWEPKGQFRWSDPFLWVIPTALYPVFSYTYAALGGVFHHGAGITGMIGANVPYFFLDYVTYGYGGVALWILGILAAFLLLSYVWVIADKMLGGLFAKSPK